MSSVSMRPSRGSGIRRDVINTDREHMTRAYVGNFGVDVGKVSNHVQIKNIPTGYLYNANNAIRCDKELTITQLFAGIQDSNASLSMCPNAFQPISPKRLIVIPLPVVNTCVRAVPAALLVGWHLVDRVTLHRCAMRVVRDLLRLADLVG
jgi:hypothetical protein